MNKSKIIISILLAVAITIGLVALIIPSGVAVEPVTAEEATWAKQFLRAGLRSPALLYMDFLDRHAGTVTPAFEAAFQPEGGLDALDGGEAVTYRVQVPSPGLYALTLECAARDRSFVSITVSVAVNGEVPYTEAHNMDIPLFWADVTKAFPLDSFGDETVPGIEQLNELRPVGLYNNTYLTAEPILFWLEGGENTITVDNKSVRVLKIGSLTVSSDRPLPAYADYIAGKGGTVVPGIEIINGTMYTEKSSTFVQLGSTNDISARPSDPVNRMVNMISFFETGAEATYEYFAEVGGLYAFAAHIQTSSSDFPTFITLRVDGGIPFAEASSFPVPPDGGRWSNMTLAGDGGEPYYIYLEAGPHTLSLRCEAEPLAGQLRDLRLLINHINQFALDVKKIAGKEADKNRTWRLTRYMPETEDTLLAYELILRGMLTELGRYSTRGVNASTLSGLVEAIAKVEKLRQKPDELPLYLGALTGDQTTSGDNSSILIRCANTLDDLLSLWFTLDEIYLYDGTDILPRARPPFYKHIAGMGQQLWASFVSPKYAVRDDPGAINIWINASAMLTDVLQKLADARFTAETGIKVNFSIMPDQNKLVLASAAGTQPDIAMSIEPHIPFDLALREALLDLTEFDDFWEVAARFAPGAMVPYVFNDGVYALSESLNFFTLVYREDILNNLGVPPPDTWYDVGEMMSELQRFDMSFYLPIASGIGYKWFYQTSPWIYQFNGAFYQEDGLGTAINQPNAVKGIAFLGELFTTYALSEQVPSFFNAFRYGQTPVGLTNMTDYLLLKYGAPELTGQWKLALPPGIPQEDGSVSRWYIANGRAAVIFNASEKQRESWEFLKWWTSEDVQSEYAFNLLSTYGYIFMPGNIEALKNTSLPDEDKAVILESIEWLRDAPRSPGHYMLERTLSDIWNSIVFDGVPAQVAIDLRTIEIQREFRRKMTEFGYADAEGGLIKPYAVRELDWMLEMLRRAAS